MIFAVGFFLVILVVVFQRMQSASASKLCFVLEEGPKSTYIAIEYGSPNASVTILERKNGKDIEPPSTAPATLEKKAVVLVDGTTLIFDDKKLTWPEGSLLAGTVFNAVGCPTY